MAIKQTKINSRLDEVSSQLEINTKHISDYENVLNYDVHSSTKDNPINVRSALQNVIYSCVKRNQKILKLPTGSYYIDGTIKIPSNLFIDFNGANICPMGGSSNFINGYMFILNDADDSDITTTYATYGIKIRDIRLNNIFNIDGIRGLFVCCTSEIYNVTSINMTNTITIKDRYIDQLKIKQIIISSPKGSDYQISQLVGSNGGNLTTTRGDAWEIDTIHIMSNSEDNQNDFKRPLISLDGSNSGVKIKNVLNGTIRLANGDFQLDNIYVEAGTLIINNAFVNIENSYYYLEGGVVPILISGNENGKPIIFKNVKFGYRGHAEKPLTKGRFYPCILIKNNFKGNITIEECSQGLPREVNSRFGIKIAHYSGNYTDYNNYIPFDLFNNNSTSLSRYSNIVDKNIISHNEMISILDTTAFVKITKDQLLVSVNRVPLRWQQESATYDYRVSAILDEQRNIGYTQPTILQATINNLEESLIKLYIDSTKFDKFKNFTLFIEKGINGEFTECAYVPMMNLNSSLYDDGLTLSGIRWKTVGISDRRTLKPSTIVKKNLITNNVEMYGGNTTVTGIWNKYDRIIQVAPSTGKDKGWVYDGSNWISEGIY